MVDMLAVAEESILALEGTVEVAVEPSSVSDDVEDDDDLEENSALDDENVDDDKSVRRPIELLLWR